MDFLSPGLSYFGPQISYDLSQIETSVFNKICRIIRQPKKDGGCRLISFLRTLSFKMEQQNIGANSIFCKAIFCRVFIWNQKLNHSAYKTTLILILLNLFALLNSACSLDANLSNIKDIPQQVKIELPRVTPDMTGGEITTVTPIAGPNVGRSYQIKAAIGEVSQKTVVKDKQGNASGWEVEAVFYE